MALFSRDKKKDPLAPKSSIKQKDVKKKSSLKPKQEKKDESSEKSSSVKPVASEQAIAPKILRRALITEKGTMLTQENKVLFEVLLSASKKQIAQAVFEAYGIRPTSVNTTRFTGKRRRFGAHVGRRSDWKKAIVTLPEGESISVHDAV